MTALRFACPTCLRKVHRAEAPTAATVVADRTCPRCGARWRFVIRPLVVRPGLAVHAIANTARLPRPLARS